jgi:hypothetical protein
VASDPVVGSSRNRMLGFLTDSSLLSPRAPALLKPITDPRISPFLETKFEEDLFYQLPPLLRMRSGLRRESQGCCAEQCFADGERRESQHVCLCDICTGSGYFRSAGVRS